MRGRTGVHLVGGHEHFTQRSGACGTGVMGGSALKLEVQCRSQGRADAQVGHHARDDQVGDPFPAKPPWSGVR